jgi:hypothetical protein
VQTQLRFSREEIRRSLLQPNFYWQLLLLENLAALGGDAAEGALRRYTAFCPFTLVRATGDNGEAAASAWLQSISRQQTTARMHAALRASAPPAGAVRTPTFPSHLTSRKVLVAEYPRSELEARIARELCVGGCARLPPGAGSRAADRSDPLLNVYLIDFHFAEHLVAYCPALDHVFAREDVSSVRSIQDGFTLDDAAWMVGVCLVWCWWGLMAF